jgi:hypothetical protein
MSQAPSELHELVDNETDPWALSGESSQVQRSLPQPDRGREAWLFLGSCFILEALIWGAYLNTKGKLRD